MSGAHRTRFYRLQTTHNTTPRSKMMTISRKYKIGRPTESHYLLPCDQRSLPETRFKFYTLNHVHRKSAPSTPGVESVCRPFAAVEGVRCCRLKGSKGPSPKIYCARGKLAFTLPRPESPTRSVHLFGCCGTVDPVQLRGATFVCPHPSFSFCSRGSVPRLGFSSAIVALLNVPGARWTLGVARAMHSSG